MNIIKLSAINSTNEYLKGLLHERHLENFTVVVAETQTEGKGQMGAKWVSEAGKNLTMSVLVKDLLLNIQSIFLLNAATAVSIAQAVGKFGVADTAVKWPNDILSEGKKVGGILIENSIRTNGEIYSVIGVGLNVNQSDFSSLPKASSLAVRAGREFDKNEVMAEILTCLKRNVALLMSDGGETLWKEYHDRLFKKGAPMPFEKDGRQFMGIIKGVSPVGTLQVLLEDDTIAEYNIKEVQLLY